MKRFRVSEIDKIKLRDARDNDRAMHRGREIPRQKSTRKLRGPVEGRIQGVRGELGSPLVTGPTVDCFERADRRFPQAISSTK